MYAVGLEAHSDFFTRVSYVAQFNRSNPYCKIINHQQTGLSV